MKTIYVTIPDDKLDELIDYYRIADPNTQSDLFSVYLSLEELKRSREEIFFLKANNDFRKSVIESLRELLKSGINGIDEMEKAIDGD